MQLARNAQREDGMALLVTVLLLLVMSAIGLNAMNRARDDGQMAGSSRAKVSALTVADSGSRVLRRAIHNAVAASPFIGNITLDDPNFAVDAYGYRTSMRTGTADSSVAQPVQRVGRGGFRSGMQINTGSGSTFSFAVYRSSVVASDPGGGNAQVQVQYSVREGKAAY